MLACPELMAMADASPQGRAGCGFRVDYRVRKLREGCMTDQSRPYAIHSASECDRLERQAAEHEGATALAGKPGLGPS